MNRKIRKAIAQATDNLKFIKDELQKKDDEGENVPNEPESMPSQFHLTLEGTEKEIVKLQDAIYLLKCSIPKGDRLQGDRLHCNVIRCEVEGAIRDQKFTEELAKIRTNQMKTEQEILELKKDMYFLSGLVKRFLKDNEG